MKSVYEMRAWVLGAARALIVCGLAAASALAAEPIAYTVTFPELKKHIAAIEAVIPTDGADAVELMMPIWSPGFYRVEDYAGRVREFTAKGSGGAELEVEKPRPNRWRVKTGGAAKVVVRYRVVAEGRSVTTNWVGDDFAVLNGAPTFVTRADGGPRPHEVALELPPDWKQSATALAPEPSGRPNHYRAADYDELVDSPILAGKLQIHPFEVEGSKHFLVDAGDLAGWDGAKGALEIEAIVRETRRFWGFLPFDHYDFLNVFRRGGGGLEHKGSTLLTASVPRASSPESHFGWLSFVSHEYFHAFNVKRLRPVGLGPFDYEKPPSTSSLWISEGLTSYFGELIVVRAGLGRAEDYLRTLSGHIDQLQNTPGRLVQTLEQSSLDIWATGYGGNRDTKVSYYVKGPVVGFLLDAHIRKLTRGKKSFDDAMRLAYERYSGARGFTADEFRGTTEEVAGADLKPWFQRALASTEELDYTPALDYFGLRFAPDPPAENPAAENPANEAKAARASTSPTRKRGSVKPKKKWTLEIKPDATGDQKARFRDWLRLCPTEPTGP